MTQSSTIDERVAKLVEISKEIYTQEHGRESGDAFQLILEPASNGISGKFFDYDWAKRKIKSEGAALKGILSDDPKMPLSAIYQSMLSALIGGGYFVEESGNMSIILQPLATSVEDVLGRADNYIANLKELNDSGLGSPRVPDTEAAYKKWLEGYHKANGTSVPEGVFSRNKDQLKGMFFGITSAENLERWARERQFVAEFYKAHDATLPEGFDTNAPFWKGHKKATPLYLKLRRWYSNSHPGQQELFRV